MLLLQRTWRAWLEARRKGFTFEHSQRCVRVGIARKLGCSMRNGCKPHERRWSVAEACPWVVTTGVVSPEDPTRPTDEKESMPLHEKWYAALAKLPPGKAHPKNFNLSNIDPFRPAPAIAAIQGGARHFAQPVIQPGNRRYSILEAKRLCGYPDDYKLTGRYGQQWRVLGNSVPPLMMREISSCVRDALLLKSET